MATSEHFTSKNSTVIEYTLGFKNNQHNKYVDTTRKTSTPSNNNLNNNYINNDSSYIYNNNNNNNNYTNEFNNGTPHQNWFDYNNNNNNNLGNNGVQYSGNIEQPTRDYTPSDRPISTSNINNTFNSENTITKKSVRKNYSFHNRIKNSDTELTKIIHTNKNVEGGRNWLQLFRGSCFERKNCCLYAIIITIFAALAIIALIVFCLLYFGVLNKLPTYLEPCTTSSPCTLYKGLMCNGTCVCEMDKYWDGTLCKTLLTFGSSCTASYQCESGFVCLNNICECPITTYYSSGSCITKKTYGSICSTCTYSTCSGCSTCSECQDYSNGYCDLSTGMCMCTAGAFYDASVSLCLKTVDFNQNCVSNSQCDSTKGLICSNGACICNQVITTNNYYWSSYYQKCMSCPIDWTVVNYDGLQTCVKDFSVTVATILNSAASSYCSSILSSSNILKLNSSSLNTAIKSILLKKDIFYWLDGYDTMSEGTFSWKARSVSASTNIDTSIINWCVNQPDGGTGENCLALAPMNWCLVDVSCATPLYTLCQTMY